MNDSSNPIRIIIADDHPLFRDGVAHSLAQEPDFMVVGQASSGEEAFKLVGDLIPDILLLDIMMPGQGGLETVRAMQAVYPTVRVMMLTVSEDQDDLMSALKAGARGYVLKGITARELANAVRTVATADVYISPSLAGEILFEMTYNRSSNPIDELTRREREILHLVGQGLTNREIGEQLHLAEKTIKHYMTSVLQKLQVRSRVEAALLARECNLRGQTDSLMVAMFNGK